MSDDVQRAITNAREELVRRLTDENEIRKIPPLMLVKVAEFLGGSRGSSLTSIVESAAARAPVEFVRSLGLPAVRQAELLAHLLGVTAEEAATMLEETDNKEE